MKKRRVGTIHPEQIAIIGSTGSIGRQTLDVIRAHPKRFKVFALAVYQNTDELLEQVKIYKPKIVAVHQSSQAQNFRKRLTEIPVRRRPLLFVGKNAWEKAATHPNVKKIVFASSGITALPALLKAITKRKKIAIANKEMLVAEGQKIMRLARKNKVTVVPIDSEHSAIFQSLQGEDPRNIEKIILTCSGGPFYGKKKEDLANLTPAQALSHPTWKMGPKISIDCATLMNKGFEIIEAKHLFNLREDQIEILIHPQSIVHSMVVFKDGNVKAQLSVPDMRIHIAYALAYPERIDTKLPRIDFTQLHKLTFLQPDFSTLPGPIIAREALKKGRKALRNLIRNNEKAVKKFLTNELNFLEIYGEIN